jgi:uncharacterized glyoxalase superfamily protein PhnB
MLSYEDVAGAADWLVRAFGFSEAERIEHDGEVVHVTLRLGSGAVMLGKPGGRLYRVEDPEGHRWMFEQA